MKVEERLAEAERRWHEFCQFLIKEEVRSSASIMDGSDLDEELVSFTCEEEVERRVIETFVHKVTGKTWHFFKPLVIVCSKWMNGSYDRETPPTFNFTCRFEDRNLCNGHVYGYAMTPDEAYEKFCESAVSSYNYFLSPERSKSDAETANAFRGLFKPDADGMSHSK